MRILFIQLCLSCALLSLQAEAKTLQVPLEYSTIQRAINAAENGDTVLVMPGTYYENPDFLGKSITLYGKCGPNTTIIDGLQRSHVLTLDNAEMTEQRIEGFTITNGFVDDLNGSVYANGGGVFANNSKLVITNNIITANRCDTWGGGIYLSYTDAEVAENKILENESGDNGGGIFCFHVNLVFAANLVSGNTSGGSGGGFNGFAYSGEKIEITGNTFNGNQSHDYGGGIDCSGADLTHNIITGNYAGDHGGGIMGTGELRHNHIAFNISEGIGGGANWGPNTWNNVIVHNTAKYHGGGINTGSGTYNSIICHNTSLLSGGGVSALGIYYHYIRNCVICGNKAAKNGGGIYTRSKSHKIGNNVIAFNEAAEGGGYHGSQAASGLMTNTILWENHADVGNEIVLRGGSELTIRNCDVSGGQASVVKDPNCTLAWGPGMIDADPEFVDPALLDFHIRYTSPCRDGGDTATGILPTDFEGDPRIVDDIVDIGADEFHTHLYYNGDAVPGGEIDVNLIGLPFNDAVLFIGSDTLNPPRNTSHGAWYLKAPVIFIDLGTMPWNGVKTLPARIPPDLPAPLDIPLQGMVRGKLTNPCKIEVILH